jgi:hypothetical protein
MAQGLSRQPLPRERAREASGKRFGEGPLPRGPGKRASVAASALAGRAARNEPPCGDEQMFGAKEQMEMPTKPPRPIRYGGMPAASTKASKAVARDRAPCRATTIFIGPRARHGRRAASMRGSRQSRKRTRRATARSFGVRGRSGAACVSFHPAPAALPRSLISCGGKLRPEGQRAAVDADAARRGDGAAGRSCRLRQGRRHPLLSPSGHEGASRPGGHRRDVSGTGRGPPTSSAQPPSRHICISRMIIRRTLAYRNCGIIPLSSLKQNETISVRFGKEHQVPF